MARRTQQEREARAAHNEALFRTLNEKLKTLNESFTTASQTFTVVCECADTNCIEMVDVSAEEYMEVRSDPRRFIVRVGHLYPDVEVVVREHARYAVVEKTGTAAEVAERLQPGSDDG